MSWKRAPGQLAGMLFGDDPRQSYDRILGEKRDKRKAFKERGPDPVHRA